MCEAADLWWIRCHSTVNLGGDNKSSRRALRLEPHAAEQFMIIYLIMSSCLYEAQQSALTMRRPHTETATTSSSFALPLSHRLQGRARPARHKGAVPEDPAGAGSIVMKVFGKEEDAELLLCSQGADRTGTLTVPDPASDFITFGRESRLVDFSAVW